MVSGEFSANNYTQEASNYKSRQSLFSCSKGTSHIHVTRVVRWLKPKLRFLLYSTVKTPFFQEQLDALVPIYSSFLFILGEHSTVIQAVRSIHVSLQLSCRACYLPANSGALFLYSLYILLHVEKHQRFNFSDKWVKKLMHFEEIFRWLHPFHV